MFLLFLYCGCHDVIVVWFCSYYGMYIESLRFMYINQHAYIYTISQTSNLSLPLSFPLSFSFSHPFSPTLSFSHSLRIIMTHIPPLPPPHHQYVDKYLYSIIYSTQVPVLCVYIILRNDSIHGDIYTYTYIHTYIHIFYSSSGGGGGGFGGGKYYIILLLPMFSVVSLSYLYIAYIVQLTAAIQYVVIVVALYIYKKKTLGAV